MVARRLELSLLVLGTLITALAYALLNVGESAGFQAQVGIFFGIILMLLVAAHVVIRFVAPNADGLLLPLAALLNGLGYVVIARLDPGLADSQAAWTFIGIGAFSATLLLLPDLRWVANYRYTLALAGVALLMLPLIPKLGVNINGARIWLRVGPFSIQPGEFAKIVLAAFLAGYLVDKRELLTISNRRLGPLHMPDIKHFGPLLLALGVALVVMVAQRDLGSSLLFFTLFLVMIYVATARTAYVVTGLVLFSAASVASWQLFDHVQRRVETWIDPFSDPKGAGFQIVEASFALADGGVTGTGLGMGLPTKIPLCRHRHDLRRNRRGNGLVGGHRGAGRLHVLRQLRLPGGRFGQRPVREAVGHRSDRPTGLPGLHHHRRRVASAATDGGHLALRLLRGFVAHLELHRAGPPGADLRQLGPVGGSRCGSRRCRSGERDPVDCVMIEPAL